MADELTLKADIRQRIASSGAIPVARFMELCLTNPEYGYYVTHDPFGESGDFTTAPEISQMFGELVGLWSAGVWREMGSPDLLRLVELGPGRGTMMLDALRALRVAPEFLDVIVVHMVEISPALEQRQRQALSDIDNNVAWHRSLDEVPEGPTIILANEFFDALPVNQAVMCADGWHERVIKVDENDNLRFSIAAEPIPLFDQFLPSNLRRAKIGEIFEWRPDRAAMDLGRRVMRSRGAALVIDYGHVESGIGDTLQSVRAHGFTDPLASPGLVDLTAHVDFQSLAHAAERMGVRVHGPIEQATFLNRLGIRARAAALKSGLSSDKAAEIDAALARLTDRSPTGMGQLFKAVAFADPTLGVLPCFER
jgi:NADH dehydrogenase [ubiquinone] 1 alpha subcomplex assembly factor 7